MSSEVDLRRLDFGPDTEITHGIRSIHLMIRVGRGEVIYTASGEDISAILNILFPDGPNGEAVLKFAASGIQLVRRSGMATVSAEFPGV